MRMRRTPEDRLWIAPIFWAQALRPYRGEGARWREPGGEAGMKAEKEGRGRGGGTWGVLFRLYVLV